MNSDNYCLQNQEKLMEFKYLKWMNRTPPRHVGPVEKSTSHWDQTRHSPILSVVSQLIEMQMLRGIFSSRIFL
jgi:hypothetical protein